LAVFELVKNAYDADSTSCTVTLSDIEDPETASICVEDDGSGMDLDTITGVWLEPGTDFRAKQRANRERTDRYRRLPLGEKGVGRFAVHKLGRQIELVTRSRNRSEVVVSIDWATFEQEKYLSQIPVTISTRPPSVFRGHRTGTRIRVTTLRDRKWTRGKVRDLYRSITSICSPFGAPGDFEAKLVVAPQSDWLEGLLDISTILDQSLFKASVDVLKTKAVYTYRFAPLPGMQRRISGRKVSEREVPLTSPTRRGEALNLGDYRIGPFHIDFHVFDREPAILALASSDRAGLKKFLDNNGGIRVYRDGVRVFDFGEPGNDWLDLGGRRVNIPTVRISNNQVVGAVSLDGEQSQDLIEKTNREGFIENDAYEVFCQAVLFAITQIEAERKKDKIRLRKEYARKEFREPVLDDLAELRNEIEKQGLEQELGKYVNRIENQFNEVRDTLLTAAGAGLTLTTVIHEVEKIIKEILSALKSNASREKVTGMVQHLSQMVDGLGFLVRKSGKKLESASALIRQALFNAEYRLKAHHIEAWDGIVREGDPDFSVKCVRRLIVSTLSNLIDNSIYWLENKGARQKKLYLGTTCELTGRPAIVVADNGPGFTDSPEYLVEPFFSRKPDGMGLGLHLASEVAKVHGGRLVFPDKGDITLPDVFTGAVIAFEFPG
jgi:signal transduction histidine kinase